MTGKHGQGSAECRELFASLSEYLDGELDAAMCGEVETHLGDCPPCQAFLESLRRTVGLARELRACELPEDVVADLLEAYRELRASGDRRSRE